MPRRARIAVLASALLVPGVTACGGASTSRAEVLGGLADDVVVPAYRDFAAAARALEASLAASCAVPSTATPDEVEGALVSATQAWGFTEAMWIGPVMDRRSWARIDYPADVEAVHALVEGAEPAELDASYIESKVGAGLRGLGAIEVVVADAALGAPSRRCAYLLAASAVVTAEAEAVVAAWESGDERDDPYREMFVDGGSDDDSTIDVMVNDLVFFFEKLVDSELGAALDASGQGAEITTISEGPFGLGLTDLRARLAGARAVLLGEGGAGLRELLEDGVVTELTGAFAAADDALGALGGPLVVAVEQDPAGVGAVRNALAAIERIVATQVVSHLGVTVGFSDSDGDGG